MRRFLLTAILATLALTSLAAQQSTGSSIRGTVRDSSGPVLSGVTVTLISSALPDKPRSTTTDNAGQYAFTDVPEGYYYISFALAGFTTVERPPFRMLGGFNARIDAALQKATPQ